MSNLPKPGPEDSLSAAERIDAVCDRFEAAWAAGRAPPLADFVDELEPAARPALLQELVLIDLEYRRRRGESRRVEDYLAEFPGLLQDDGLLPDALLRRASAIGEPRGGLPDPSGEASWSGRTPVEGTGALFCPHCGALIPDQPGAAPAEGARYDPAATHEISEGAAPEVRCPTCGRYVRPVPGRHPALKTPSTIGGYQLLKEVGRGALGTVYMARDARLGRTVAVKTVVAGPHAHAEWLARFRREGEVLARLHHPNIVQIFDVGEQDAVSYFVMEFMPGGNLKAKLAHRPLPSREAARLVETLARAMQYAHQLGVIHRDLKPANVLLTEDGTPKISDFGLARVAEGGGEVTGTGVVIGTPAYMAPEQADQSREVGVWTDVYALGAVLYELLTAQTPFQGATALETLDRVRWSVPVPPRALQPQVSRDLETICLKCLREEPEKRYAGALQLAEDLRRFLNQEPIQARPVPAWERGLKWARRQPATAMTLVAASMTAILALVVSSWYNAHLLEDLGKSQRRQREAEEERTICLRAIDDVLRTLTSPRLRRDGQTALTRQMLEALIPPYEEVLRLEGQDDATRERQGVAWNQLGMIRQALGENGGALDAAGRAEAIFRGLAGRPGRPASARAGLATALNLEGEILGLQGECLRGIAALKEAAELLTELVGEEEGDSNLRYRLALAHNNWANCLMRSPPPAPGEAESHYREAVKHFAGLASTYPGEILYGDWHARTLSNLALQRFNTGAADARGTAAEAVSVARRLAAAFPGEIDGRECLAVCLSNEGTIRLELGDAPAAVPRFEEALKLYEGLARQVPASVEFRWGAAKSESDLGAALAAGPAKGWPRAAEHFAHADAAYEELLQANSENQELRRHAEENRKRQRELDARRRVP